MTFETRESSRHLGEPVELYLFRYGDAPTAYYAYTDAEEPITHQDIVYEPQPIKRDSVTASGALGKSNLEISTAQTVELAELFRLYPPSQVVSVVIRQGHLSDPDDQFLVAWTGRVISHKRAGSEATYTCEPIATSMRRAGLRRAYQYGCPHVLYGPMCRADQEAHTIVQMVLSVAGPVVTLASTWEVDLPTKFEYRGGLFTYESIDGRTEIRTILKIIDSTHILLTGTATGLVPGVSVELAKGCQHTTEDCEGIFDNILNYGGQPWIPTENPIGIKNNFY